MWFTINNGVCRGKTIELQIEKKIIIIQMITDTNIVYRNVLQYEFKLYIN